MNVGAYGIRSDYQPNPVNQSFDEVSGEEFWTPDRIATSARHQRAVYRLARRLAQDLGTRRVIDVGCGLATKLMAFFDSEYDLIGLDQESAVEMCRQMHDRGTFIGVNLLDTSDIASLRQTADLVICSDVIEHVEDPDVLLALLRNLARGDARVVISTPERVALHGPDVVSPTNPVHIREWSRDELATYLTSSGFDVQSHSVLFPFSPKVDPMTVRYVLDRVRRRRPWRTTQVAVCRLAS